jgi:hypothetical protein
VATGAVTFWANLSTLNHHLERRNKCEQSGKQVKPRVTNFWDDAMEMASFVTESAFSG